MSLTNIKINRIDEIYNMYEAALDKQALSGGLIETDAVGQSMGPTIVSGDRIVIDSTKIGELKEGDIIAFGKNSLLICHRIKEVRERDGRRYFITVGDAHEKEDNFEVGINEIAGKVVKIIKRSIGSRFLLYTKNTARAILRFLGIDDLSKEVFYRLIKSKVKYYLLIPRNNDTHPAYKFINLPLEDILDGSEEFFAPLNSIGGFKVTATIGKYRAGMMEFYKVSRPGNSGSSWMPASRLTSQIFSRTSLEADLWETGRLILEKVNFKLEQKPQIKIRLHWPFVSLFRWALLSLQGLSVYRSFTRRLFHRRIKFVLKEDRQGSYRFLATLGRFTAGSVSLVERKSGTGLSEWWVYSLQVSMLLRGLGIAQELMDRLISFAKSKGAGTLRLTVRYDKTAAVKLYKKMGFIKICTDRYNLVLMEKNMV